MGLGKHIKEYWRVFWNSDDAQQNVQGVQIALLLMSGFGLIMSAMNIANGNMKMLATSMALFVLFLVSALLYRRPNGRMLTLIVCVFSVVIIFSYYVLAGESDGFAVLWTVLAPMFLMAAVGVKAGTLVGVYFELLFIVLFWTPLRPVMAIYYTETFMNRYPVLYLCLLIVSLAIMLVRKGQQLQIDHHRENLEKAVRDERDNVKHITFQTIATITGIVDAKDQYTDQHSARVAQYSAMIAEELGWDREEVDGVYFAALLHDIGKVGIRDDILNKNGGLDPEEFRIMKTHTTIGAKILNELTFLKGASEGALYHHEKYDGSGYPFGLKGTAIPMLARIICLADSFDAMNTKRAYKEKCDEEYILQEVRNGRGKHFDPEVVDAFLRCVDNHTIVFTRRKM